MKTKENWIKWSTQISQKDFLALTGLMYLAHKAYKEAGRCDKAMHEIIKSKEDYTLLSDEWLQDSVDIKKVLKNMRISVK